MPRSIDTDGYSARLRARAVDLEGHRLLVAQLGGSEQEADLSEPVNCGGIGRIRHFRRDTSPGWPLNGLPIDPACRALGIPSTDVLRAQVFQNAACNWRCWYCFVPYPLLSASEKRGVWVDADDLVTRYLAEPDRPAVIDLSGGQPDLIPEWTPWMLRALARQGAAESTYVWVDDNLSNDYFWRYLSDEDVELVARWPMFGRVGCFKGFDDTSFAFNTKAEPELFDRQFELFSRHLALGVDLYAYTTFTGPDANAASKRMPEFVDRLQHIHELLPLRTIPLEVSVWGPVRSRMNPLRRQALEVQHRAIEAWNLEVESRFPAELRALPISSVPMKVTRGG